MTDEHWARERPVRHRALGDMWCRIHNETRGNHLDPADLTTAHIQTAPLSLDGETNLRPQFFAKYHKEIPYRLDWWEDETLHFLDCPPRPDRLDVNTDSLCEFLVNHFEDCYSYNWIHNRDTMSTTSHAWAAYVICL